MHRADPKEQFIFLLYSFIIGVLLSVFYDIFVLIRRFFPKTPSWLVFIEDTVYCLVSGFIYFVFIFSANLGVPRLYSFAGSLFGFIIWRKTFSNLLISLAEKILNIISAPVLFVLSIIAKIARTFLCKIMIYLKTLKYLFIFSKKRDIIKLYIKRSECFEFENKEEYVKL